MVVIATLGGINGNILGGARVLYAMADAGNVLARSRPGASALRHAGGGLIVQGLVSIVFVFTGGFNQLLTNVLFAPGCSMRSGASPYSCSGGATISSVHTGSGVIQWCPASSPFAALLWRPRWHPLRATRPSAADSC